MSGSGKKIVVISDTHIPRSASDLPKEVYDSIKKADLVLHAGDFSEFQVLRNLERIKNTVAVYGNMDSAQLKGKLKPKEIICIGNIKIGLIHGGGPPSGLIEHVGREFKNVDAIVFGHAHSPTNLVRDGVLFFNPGSPTDRVFSAYNSYGILHVSESSVKGDIVRIERKER
ncbi:metallophosphoesterase family protein [Candidatus Omnitrophota bacterium]